MCEGKNNMLLKNGIIYTAESDRPFEGDILIRNGKIEGISQKIAVSKGSMQGDVIDIQGKTVVPGFLDISTCIGITEAGKRIEETNKTDMHNRITPNLRMLDGIDWRDEYFRKACENGVTTVVVNSKYESPIGGRSCALKTCVSSPLRNRIVSPYADLHGTMGNRVKNNYDATRISPLSRMGIMRALRDVLFNWNTAVPCGEQSNRYKNDGSDDPIRAVREKKTPLKITASLYRDIQALIDLIDELDINLILDEGAESYLVLEELKKRGIPVVLGSLFEDDSREDLVNRQNDTGAVLEKWGIPICFSTHHPQVSIELYHVSACLHIREGVSEKAALKAMTINPARALGLDHRIGSLREGKDADMLVFDGNPFKSLTPLSMTIINGEICYDN